MFYLVLLASAFAAISGTANAHVTLAKKEAPADSDYVAKFLVPHGWEAHLREPKRKWERG